MIFSRPNPDARCNPYDLAVQIATALSRQPGSITCDINKGTVVVYQDVTGFESTVQSTIDAYVYDPDFGLDPTRKSNRDQLRALRAKNENLSTAEVKDAVVLLLKHLNLNGG